MMLAQRSKKPIIAVSDAHFYSEIGAYRVMVNSTDVQVGILNGNL